MIKFFNKWYFWMPLFILICVLAFVKINSLSIQINEFNKQIGDLEKTITSYEQENSELKAYLSKYESDVDKYKQCYKEKGFGDICQIELEPVFIKGPFDLCLEGIAKELIVTAGLQGGKLTFEDPTYREFEGYQINYLNNDWTLKDLESQFEGLINAKAENCEEYKKVSIQVEIEPEEIKLSYDGSTLKLTYPLGFLFDKAQNRDFGFEEITWEKVRPYPDELYKLHKRGNDGYLFQFFIQGTPL